MRNGGFGFKVKVLSFIIRFCNGDSDAYHAPTNAHAQTLAASFLTTRLPRITKDKREEIFMADQLTEFVPGTKVSMRGEFGVVLSKTDGNLVGLIRWDTAKENDIEDWRGLFGSFLAAGGQIADQYYKFKFIDDQGQLKKVVP